MTSSAQVHLGWGAWSKEKGTSGKSAQTLSCRYCALSVSSVRVLMIVAVISFYLSGPLQMVPAFSTQHRNRRHSMSYASMRCIPFSYLPLQLPKALLTARPHRRATHFRSCTSQIRSTVTVSWFPQAGTAGERLQCYAMDLTRKRGARRGNTISRLSLVLMEGVKQAHGNNTRRSCQTKARRHVSFFFFPLRTLGLTPTAIADPAPVIQQSNARASLPFQKLRRERAAR